MVKHNGKAQWVKHNGKAQWVKHNGEAQWKSRIKKQFFLCGNEKMCDLYTVAKIALCVGQLLSHHKPTTSTTSPTTITSECCPRFALVTGPISLNAMESKLVTFEQTLFGDVSASGENFQCQLLSQILVVLENPVGGALQFTLKQGTTSCDSASPQLAAQLLPCEFCDRSQAFQVEVTNLGDESVEIPRGLAILGICDTADCTDCCLSLGSSKEGEYDPGEINFNFLADFCIESSPEAPTFTCTQGTLSGCTISLFILEQVSEVTVTLSSQSCTVRKTIKNPKTDENEIISLDVCDCPAPSEPWTVSVTSPDDSLQVFTSILVACRLK